jgi:SAM-dependent methyltransferase
MLNKLRAIYRREMFFPSILGVFFNPFYFARSGLNTAMIKMSTEIEGDLLDVGCGTKPYKEIFKVASYTGLDIDSKTNREIGIADDFYDGERFPYQDSSFDSVLCNQVLEHVFNPDEFLTEINRVLKPEGQLLLTVPFVWDEHEQPFDYARYSSFGLRALLEKNGFKVIRHEKLGADATTLFQLTNAYLFKVIRSWPRALNLLFTITVIATINLVGIIARRLLPANPDLFLDHVVLAKKIS